MKLDALIEFYNDFSPASVARFPEFYSADAWFKDPFNEVRGIAAIQHIFTHMFGQVAEPRFVVTEQVIDAVFTAGAIGYVIANNATISGAAGGCQAEVGSAAAMAAAAAVELAGGTPAQAAQAAAMTLKNLLGLACNPVAGLVEVPCVKRNAGGAAIALTAAEMALAGVSSRIPPDEVVQAMYAIGTMIPEALRETAGGGLAATTTGRAWKKKYAHSGKVVDK